MEETLAKMDSVVETRTARTSQGTATKTPTAAMTPIDRVMMLPMSELIIYANNHHTGEGDQFVFDVDTVLGQQMFKTLDWLDEADVETTVTCCNGKGDQVERKCGGRTTTSCKDVCGKGGLTMFVLHLTIFSLQDLDSTLPSTISTTPNVAQTCSTATPTFGKLKTCVQLRRSGCPTLKRIIQLTSIRVFPVTCVGKGRAMTKSVIVKKREHVPQKVMSVLILSIVLRTNYTPQKRFVKNQTNSAAWNRSSGGMPYDREVIRILRQLGISVASNTRTRQKELIN